jgi:hypothetical protein
LGTVSAYNPNAFSFSSLKKYENCPKQYSEIVVFQNYKDVFTDPKGGYGDRLHKAAEQYIKHSGALEPEFTFIKPILDTLRNVAGEKRTEHKMGVKHDGSATRWNDPERWFQGIADLTIIGDSPVARVVDYKAGDSKYADTDQLELMALLIFANFPHVKLVKGALLFVLNEQIRKRTVDITEKDRLWQKYRERHAKIVGSHAANNWPMKESGLCRRHCCVLSCIHNGRK